ncbi:hypothetical protein Taro_006432 [Colocasia esculenta]|uniref:Protein FAR1-RELATED SEQUENCE n=1 Tax=Colocasia esculenta TaxID=4460 RepID=A0A843TW09_COLES|nr:hypothetical protein [Colocasia esculenta]
MSSLTVSWRKTLLPLLPFPPRTVFSPSLLLLQANNAESLLPLSAPSPTRTSRSPCLPSLCSFSSANAAKCMPSFLSCAKGNNECGYSRVVPRKRLWLTSLKLCFYLALCLKAIFREGVIGMSSSQRSESIHHFFDGYVQSKTTLGEFIDKYSVALDSRYDAENEADELLVCTGGERWVTYAQLRKEGRHFAAFALEKEQREGRQGLRGVRVGEGAERGSRDFALFARRRSREGEKAVRGGKGSKRNSVFLHETVSQAIVIREITLER